MSGLRFQGEIRTLLADDEQVALLRLKKALLAFPQVKVIAQAMDGETALGLINSLRPDLVFLDIQMPGLNGFEVLARLQYTPLIVFVTAYQEYAIRAFEKNSLDYLLKPVEQERLTLTVKRIFENQSGEADLLLKLKKLIEGSKKEDVISTIPVKSGNKISLVHAADVCFFEAKDKYVTIYTEGEEKIIEYSLTYLEGRLPAEFLRVHRSFIVNKLKILEIRKYFKGTYILVMNDAKGTKIKSTYSYYEAIKNKLLLP